MPDPSKKRKRQARERVANRKAHDPTTVASETAETDEGESSYDGPTKGRTTHQGAGPGEYRPL